MSDTQQRIQQIVSDNRVVLFMKGDRDFPQCGFSNRAVNIINTLGVPYETVNVLADNAIRQGIKEFANWPTIPQLYIDGEFIGGSDILWEMYQNDELEPLVADHPKVGQ